MTSPHPLRTFGIRAVEISITTSLGLCGVTGASECAEGALAEAMASVCAIHGMAGTRRRVFDILASLDRLMQEESLTTPEAK